MGFWKRFHNQNTVLTPPDKELNILVAYIERLTSSYTAVTASQTYILYTLKMVRFLAHAVQLKVYNSDRFSSY